MMPKFIVTYTKEFTVHADDRGQAHTKVNELFREYIAQRATAWTTTIKEADPDEQH